MPAKCETARYPDEGTRTASKHAQKKKRMNQSQSSSKLFAKQSTPLTISDNAIRESAAGAHQRLIRQGDRYVLIVRSPGGAYIRHNVTVMENGVYA
jgi:hypothetical protein